MVLTDLTLVGCNRIHDNVQKSMGHVPQWIHITVEALEMDTCIPLVVSSTYSHLHKTPFFSTLMQTLYSYIPITGQLQLGTPFLRFKGVRL